MGLSDLDRLLVELQAVAQDLKKVANLDVAYLISLEPKLFLEVPEALCCPKKGGESRVDLV